MIAIASSAGADPAAAPAERIMRHRDAEQHHAPSPSSRAAPNVNRRAAVSFERRRKAVEVQPHQRRGAGADAADSHASSRR